MRDDVGEQVLPVSSGATPRPDPGAARRDSGLLAFVCTPGWLGHPADPERLHHEHAAADGSFTQVVVDKVLVHKSWSTLDVLVIAFVAVILFENLLGYLRTYTFSHTTQRVDVELGAQLYHHALHLPLAYYQVRRVGHTVARIRELESIRQFLTSNALTSVIDLLFTVIFFAVMLAYSAKLTLIVALAVPVFAGIVVALSPVLRRRVEEKFNRGAESQSFLVESIAGIETAKSMALEPQMQRRWESLLASFTLSSFRAQNVASLGSHLIQTVAKLVTAATLYFGAQAAIAGELTVGMYIAFSMFAGHAIAPILRLSQMWQDLQQFRISLARIGDILDTPTEPAWKPGRVSPARIEGRITFDNVTFAYGPDRQPVLNDVSFEIAPGEIVAVVGTSGSGKSTLAKLINRLYVPTGGRVLIDCTDLALVDTAWLRSQIGVVPQENVLFTGTIRDNIAQADPAAPMERVVRAAKLAGAHEFILSRPEGYEAQVEERGMNLSGGQRQRVAIARALFTDPRVLIFDEATSALDMDAEAALMRNMAEIAKGRTVIIIAHRSSALRQCSSTIRLQEGTIGRDSAR